MNLGVLNSEQMRLIARVLVMHYEEGHSQADIAKELELSTAKVNRLMKQGRELGMVQITIKTPLLRLFDLEKKIAKRWNLKKCLVLPAVDGNPELTLNEVGKGAANLLLDSLRDGDTVAISGGKTISAIIENMVPERAFDVKVVPMTGGVQGQHYTDVNHIATSMAERLQGKATLIHAPLHAASQEERDIIMSLKSVRAVMEEAHRAAVAVVGVGAVVGDNATYYEAHPVSSQDRDALYASGVRSEFLGHLINQDGSLSSTELNKRLVSLSPDKMSKIPVCIGVAVGKEKVEPIIAALNGCYFNSLVTDEQTAAAMLEKEEVHA